ncbi:MAG: molybdopterin-binding protein [Polyangiaceae bacterium]
MAGEGKTAAALVIGNELLSGKIADENVVVLARTLRSLGIRLLRVDMVLDEPDVITAEVRALAQSHDVLFTSGGVGPTHDDLTVDAVAAAFDVPVIMHPDVEAKLRGYYGDRLTEGHLRMARVPEGAQLVVSGALPWPTMVMHNVWILPGVPQIFAAKMDVVRAELGGGTPFVSLAVLTKLDEGPLKPLLDRVVADFPEVMVGSYPRWQHPRYRTKITFDATDDAACGAARDAFVALLPEGALVPGDAD